MVMAHQGCQGSYPSNSFAAIVKAFDQAEEVEFDVYRVSSAQGERIICCHPETYFLFVSPKGMQNAGDFPLTFEETQRYLWQGMALMPDLEDVLDAWASSQRTTRMQIELKGPRIPEVLIPLLQKRFTTGLLDPDMVALTGLCYAGDRTRITEVRSLDDQIPLVLPLRGDWNQDGFDSIEDAVSFAKEQKVWMITVQRKLLQPEWVEVIHQAGIVSGTFHGRTSDELEAALALGVTYIAADRFETKIVSDYESVHQLLTPVLYRSLRDAGFYRLRDWIWELGWQLEKEVRTLPREQSVAQNKCDAFCSVQEDAITLTLFDAVGEQTLEGAVSLEGWTIPGRYLGALDDFQEKVSFLDLVSERGLERTLMALLHNSLSLAEAIELSEKAEQGSDSSVEAVIAREVLIRAGRIIGMLAFSALNPRHTKKDSVTLGVSSLLCSRSTIVQRAAQEQIEAQLLRSGVFSATVRFF